MAHRYAPYNSKLFKPTDDQRRQVLTMTGFGIRQEEMARSLQIDKKTLIKHFRHELDTGMTEANVRVAQALYTNAVKNMNVAAQIWWTKTRMGWKDKSVMETNGALVVDFRWQGDPIQISEDESPEIDGEIEIEVETAT